MYNIIISLPLFTLYFTYALVHIIRSNNNIKLITFQVVE